jgi:hypothetical protein
VTHTGPQRGVCKKRGTRKSRGSDRSARSRMSSKGSLMGAKSSHMGDRTGCWVAGHGHSCVMASAKVMLPGHMVERLSHCHVYLYGHTHERSATLAVSDACKAVQCGTDRHIFRLRFRASGRASSHRTGIKRPLNFRV